MSDARKQAEAALADYCGAYTECMNEDERCDKKMERALRALLAELTCECGKPRLIGPCSG